MSVALWTILLQPPDTWKMALTGCPSLLFSSLCLCFFGPAVGNVVLNWAQGPVQVIGQWTCLGGSWHGLPWSC